MQILIVKFIPSLSVPDLKVKNVEEVTRNESFIIVKHRQTGKLSYYAISVQSIIYYEMSMI